MFVRNHLTNGCHRSCRDHPFAYCPLQALLADAASAAPDATIAASVFVTSGSTAAVAAASTAFAMPPATGSAARQSARQPPYAAPPNSSVTIAKLTFVQLADEQHTVGGGSTAGRTGLLGLARQLAAAPQGGRVQTSAAGVQELMAPILLRCEFGLP